jgi:hypothetical protein
LGVGGAHGNKITPYIACVFTGPLPHNAVKLPDSQATVHKVCQRKGAHSNTDSLSSGELSGSASMGLSALKAKWSPVNATCASAEPQSERGAHAAYHLNTQVANREARVCAGVSACSHDAMGQTAIAALAFDQNKPASCSSSGALLYEARP